MAGKNSDLRELREQVLIDIIHNGIKEAEIQGYANLAGAYLELGDFKLSTQSNHCQARTRQSL